VAQARNLSQTSAIFKNEMDESIYLFFCKGNLCYVWMYGDDVRYNEHGNFVGMVQTGMPNFVDWVDQNFVWSANFVEIK
jgi:hypothetical protein